MTPDDFNTLDHGAQIRLAMKNDMLVGCRSEGPRSMHLYQVEGFYVEIVYTTRRKMVIDILASSEESLIQPYLDQIDISELLM